MMNNTIKRKICKYKDQFFRIPMPIIILIFNILFIAGFLVKKEYFKYQMTKNFNYSYPNSNEIYVSEEEKKVGLYIEEFYRILSENDIQTDIKFVDFMFSEDKDGNHGSCYQGIYYPFQEKRAKINFSSKIFNNEALLKTTVFHELAHCILNLDHYDEILTTPKGLMVPISIMHSEAYNDNYVYEHMNLYIVQMLSQYYNQDQKEPETLLSYVMNYPKIQYKYSLDIIKSTAINEKGATIPYKTMYQCLLAIMICINALISLYGLFLIIIKSNVTKISVKF